MQEKIGTTAGSIYNYLSAKGENTTTTLRKDLELDDPGLVSLGLGWLAREGKVQIRTKGKTVFVSLIPGA